MAGRGPDERWGRLARLDRGEVKARPSGFPEERPERRDAIVERREARVPVTRHAASPPRCHRYRSARTGAPLPHACEGKGNEGAPRAAPTPGADGARLYVC